MRNEHLIRRTSSDGHPRQVMCVQASARRVPIEGVPHGEREELTSWCVEAWRYQSGEAVRVTSRSGTDTPSFWRELDRVLYKGTLTWVFSHDAYRVMTLLGFWGLLERDELSLYGRETADARAARKGVRRPGVGYIVLEDPPTIVQFRRVNRPGLAKWIDVRNYTALDVSALRHADEVLAATARFVHGMLAAVKASRLGSLANTASGQAWAAWRRSHCTHPVLVHTHEPALVLERQAYVGGRCEVFRMGEVPPPVYHLDFRAHYASCYEHADLPVSLEWYGEFPGGSCDLSAIDPTCTIADVMIDTDTPDYPAVREVKGGTRVQSLRPGEPPPCGRALCLCVYPVGRFRTVLVGPEVAHALDRGRVVRVYRAARYRVGPALRAVAAAFRDLRSKCQLAKRKDLEFWVKLMQVGLAGRFGMHGRKWVLDDRIEPCNPYETWWVPGEGGVPERWRSLAWKAQREVIERDGPESVCAVAAWITSLARVKLLEAFDGCGRENVHYTHTDSVWTNQTGLVGLRSGGMLGSGEPGLLQIVRVHQDVEFLGYNHYRADERHVCAGRPAECAGGDEQPEKYRRRERAKGGVKVGTTPQVRSVLTDWRRSAPYLHGHVGPGGVVRPLVFWEE